MRKIKWKRLIVGELVALAILSGIFLYNHYADDIGLFVSSIVENRSDEQEEKDYIKWVEFNVTYEALQKAYQLDVETHGGEVHLRWVELLAYLGAKYGGDFGRYRASDMQELADLLLSGEETMESLTKEKEYFAYYLEAYTAVLGGMIGEFKIEVPAEEGSEEKIWEERYGLKAFSPVAKGYGYSNFDDFGVSRGYGYRRRHLGHDMMGLVGTPIIAVESGYVEVMGWNQYGGWRIGIRSFDGMRYYYYAHLRQNVPFHVSLQEGSVVTAGDVIGYMGHTGYSTEENVNNIKQTHLHWGLQLIFDESQKEGVSEIWVDLYALTRFLSHHRSETWKDEETKEHHRKFNMRDPLVELYRSFHGSETSDPEDEAPD